MDETDEMFSAELDAHGDAAESALVLALAALYAANNEPSEEQIQSAINGVVVAYLLAVLLLLSESSQGETSTEPIDLYQIAEEMSSEAAELLKDELTNMTREVNQDPSTRGFDGTDFRARLRALSAAALTSVTNRGLLRLAQAVGFSLKSWRTRLDIKVRLAHQSLEGQTVPMNGTFVDFQGVRLEYPGDRRAPIASWIQCRCRLSFSRVRTA